MELNRSNNTKAIETPIQDKITTLYDLNDPTRVTFNEFSPQEMNSQSHAEQSTFIHINPKPLREELADNENKATLTAKTTIGLVGDNEFIITEDIIPYFENAKKTGRIIENLIFAEIEISAHILQTLLFMLKPSLKALSFLRVPLDHEHLEILNQLGLNLEFLSISYAETDESNPFCKEQQQQAYKPFDINKLDFPQLGPNLKFLQLQGISLNKGTFDTLVASYANSLEVIILEELKNKDQSKEELLKHIFSKIKSFKNLKGLSLAKNNLNPLDLSQKAPEECTEAIVDIELPQTLTALNLNYCNLDNKQVHDLVGVLNKSQNQLKALHLQDAYVYSRTLEEISKLSKNKEKFRLEIPKLVMDPNSKTMLRDSNSKTQIFEPSQVDVFAHTQETASDIRMLKTEKTNLKWISELTKREDFIPFVSFLLKIFREVKFLNDAYNLKTVNFSVDPKMLIPKHDVNQLIHHLAQNLSQTLQLEETSLVGEYDAPLIRKVHPKILRDEAWAKFPLKNQRDKFLSLMKNLGYQNIEKKHNDCFEDMFIVQMRAIKQVCYDLTLSTFSLFWYHNQVSLKFNMSDDWYLNRNQRVNRYAMPNQDFLISFCSEWNSHTTDFVFEFDIIKDGETEVKFKSTIMKEGDLNVAKALLIAIDKGFVMLKALHKLDLFDKGDTFTGGEDSRKLRRIIKAKLRQYAKSKDFENLLRQEKTLLQEDEEIEGEAS